MIAATIAGASVLIAITMAMLVLGLALRDAERRVADARVDAATKAGTIAIRDSEIATWKAAAANETRRADALDDALDEVAASGDVHGARARVLSSWARPGTPGPDPVPTPGDAPSPVPAPPPTAPAVDRDRLERPGG